MASKAVEEGEDVGLKGVDPYIYKPEDVKPITFTQIQFYYTDWKIIMMTIVGIIGCAGFACLMPAFSYLMGDSFDTLAQSDNASVDYMDEVEGLALNFVYFAGVVAVGACLLSFGWGYVGKMMSNRIKIDYFKNILKQEQLFFDNVNTFEFATKVNSQTDLIEKGLGTKVGHILLSIFMLIFSYLVGFLVSWKLSLMLMAVVPLLLFSGAAMFQAMKDNQVLNRKAFEEAGGIAEEVLYNIKTVASFANFDFERQRFHQKVEMAQNQGKKVAFKLGIFNGLVFFMIFFSYVIAFLYGSYLIGIRDDRVIGDEITAGSVIICLFSIVFGSFTLSQSAPHIGAAKQALAAAEEFFVFKNRECRLDTSKATKSVNFEEMECSVQFKNVTFKYHPEKPTIIKNFTNTFEAGKKTAIVGSSGSGKSTLISMIERLYDPNEGSISIGNEDLTGIKVAELRGAIGYVPQEPVLFDTSIRENILFGREASEEEVIEACRKAYALDFINKIDDKLDYRVGIKGSRLSGGQKQRVAIARAILKKPKILLLDEATSALDNISEKKVQKALDEVSRGVTTIIIAHRLSTILNAEKIVVMDAGEIVQEGTHESLIKVEGRYLDLVKNQIDLNVQVDKEIEEQGEDEEKLEEKFVQKEIVNELEEKKNKQKEDQEFFKQHRSKILAYLSAHRGEVIISIIATCMAGAIWPVYGLFLADAQDELIKESATDHPDFKHDVIFVGFKISIDFFILALISGLAVFYQIALYAKFGEIIACGIRKDVYDKYLTLDMGFFDNPKHSPGSLLTKLSTDTNNVNGVALSIIGAAFQSSASMIIGIVMSFIFSWQLALAVIVCTPFIGIATHIKLVFDQGMDDSNAEVNMEAGSLLSEAVNNTRAIFSYNMTDKMIEYYEARALKGSEHVAWDNFKFGAVFGISQTAMFLTYALLFWLGGLLVDDERITFLEMNRAIFSLMFAAFAMGMSALYLGDQQKTQDSFVKLFRIMETESKIEPSAEDGKSVSSIKGDIEFKNVSFCYPTRPDEPVIKNLSFKIEAGQKAAFVGASGSGKSTVIQLIERFYDCGEGEILIDGVNVKEYKLDELRKRIGIVFQEPTLFKTNIRENIRYGDLNASDAAVDEAAKQSLIDHKLKTESLKEIANLSGGEKQRVAIARAVIKNPAIMLMDEATSALDKNSEEKVQEALNQVINGKTSVSIAHRLSTIYDSDVIFLMERGEIKEQGTHNELIAMQGKYYKLYQSMNK